VRLNSPGVEVRPIREINGDSEFCQEFLDDVEVAPDAVVGDVDGGWTVSQTMLMYERGGGSPVSSAEAVVERGFAPELVGLAQRVGRENDPVARQSIARAHTYSTVQIHLGRRIAQHFVHDPERAVSIASYGKLTWGTFDPIRGRLAMAIGARAALAWDAEIVEDQWPALNYLNSRVNSIAGGTNEMMRNIIAERVLGLPREPSFDTKKPFREVQRIAAEWK
jgi:alkylation response protein AidB-like acyl-CoA dehydrogenase